MAFSQVARSASQVASAASQVVRAASQVVPLDWNYLEIAAQRAVNRQLVPQGPPQPPAAPGRPHSRLGRDRRIQIGAVLLGVHVAAADDGDDGAIETIETELPGMERERRDAKRP